MPLGRRKADALWATVCCPQVLPSRRPQDGSQSADQVPVSQTSKAHSEWTQQPDRGERREKNNVRMKGPKDNRQSKEKQIQSWGEGGSGEVEAEREGEKRKAVGGGESEPQENVRYMLEREEDELPVRNYTALKPTPTKKQECFSSHLIYGRTQVWGARPCVTTFTIWIYLLCLAFQENTKARSGDSSIKQFSRHTESSQQTEPNSVFVGTRDTRTVCSRGIPRPERLTPLTAHSLGLL